MRTQFSERVVCALLIQRLFADRFVGQHRPDQFRHRGAAHSGGLLTQTQNLVLCSINRQPDGYIGAVGVTVLCKVCEVAHHLGAQYLILGREGTPAVVERAEPVPEIAAVPCTAGIAGQLAVEGVVVLTQGDSVLDPEVPPVGAIRLRRGPRWRGQA